MLIKHADIAKYVTPSHRRSIAEIAITLILLLLGVTALYFAVQHAIWLLLILIIPISFLFARIFILQHDLGHGNLFRLRKHNDLVGNFLGILVMTPYHLWRKAHAVHHVSGGDADKRPWMGDIDLLTVREYEAKGSIGKFLYRVYRNPLVMFFIGGIYVFLIDQRFYKKVYREHKSFGKKEFWNVVFTNIAIIILYGPIIALMGIKLFSVVLLIPMCLGGAIGIYLFYVQHNFKDRYFVPKKEWTLEDSALKGSTFYDLPQPLKWLTACIGYHHVHTLIPRIPFYKLEQCHRENEFFNAAPRYGLKNIAELVSLKLYDEETQQMLTWPEYKKKNQEILQV